jgi:hypothetical protein
MNRKFIIAVGALLIATPAVAQVYPYARPNYNNPPPVQYQSRPVDNSRSVFEASQNRTPVPAPVPPSLAPVYRPRPSSMYETRW